MGFGFQDVGHDLTALRADGAGPVDESARGPVQMLLVRLGTVGRIGGEATPDPTAHMGSHAATFVQQLHGVCRQPHLHLLLGQGVGHRVEMPVHLHVVVDVGLGHRPLTQLVAAGR